MSNEQEQYHITILLYSYSHIQYRHFSWKCTGVYIFGPSLPTSSYHLPVVNFLPSFKSSFPICFSPPPLHPQLASLAVNHDCTWWCWWWMEMNNNGQIICRWLRAELSCIVLVCCGSFGALLWFDSATCSITGQPDTRRHNARRGG